MGKGGQGISEPITAAGVTNRQGFGSASVDQDFKFKMKKLVQVLIIPNEKLNT